MKLNHSLENNHFCETSYKWAFNAMYMLNMLHESESVKRGSDLAKLAIDYSNRRTRNHDIVIMVFDNYQEISLKKLLHEERNKNTATKHITKTLMRSTLLQTFPNYL